MSTDNEPVLSTGLDAYDEQVMLKCGCTRFEDQVFLCSDHQKMLVGWAYDPARDPDAEVQDGDCPLCFESTADEHTHPLDEKSALTDELIEAEVRKYADLGDPERVAFRRGMERARDFSTPMPTREQIARALDDADPEPKLDGPDYWRMADAVLSLIGNAEPKR